MPKLRVHNFSISLDGYAAGPDQSLDKPFGVIRGPGLHEWMFATRTGRQMLGTNGGDEGIDDGIEAALERVLDAAGGNDLRIGGGAATVQQYLRAGLIDDLHLVIVPILLGGGERLFDHLDGAVDGDECVEMVGSPAVTHIRLSRAPK